MTVSKRRERRLVDEAAARRAAAASARLWRSSDSAGITGVEQPDRAVAAPSWPPPRTRGDRYVEVLLLEQGVGMPVRLREVRLWGRLVAIGEDGRVYCPTCMRMVDVGELGRAASVHRLLVPLREDC